MQIKQVALVLATILLISQVLIFPVAKVSARANINDYLNQMYGAPNGFEPSGWNTTGTTTWLDVQLTAGWKHMSGMGNLGIGNGSIATFGDKDSLPANQSDPYFMGADVSQQPLDPIRELNLNVASLTSEENTKKQSESETVANETATNETAADVTVSNETTPPGLTQENLTYSAYHPISLGAPANDLLYEHPLTTSVSMYCRLIGLEVPGEGPINIGMKCLGYGY